MLYRALLSPFIARALMFALTTALAACGGGGGGGGGSGGSSTPASQPRPVLSGVFSDSPIENIAFRTDSQSGFTDSDGTFLYLDGETVTFSIGGIDLPAITAASLLTPKLMGSSGRIDDPIVLNILRLLQSLDVDGNPDNGIEISDQAHTVADAMTVDFDDPDFDTAVTNLVANSGATRTALISSGQALAHFNDSIDNLQAGLLSLFPLNRNVRYYYEDSTGSPLFSTQLTGTRQVRGHTAWVLDYNVGFRDYHSYDNGELRFHGFYTADLYVQGEGYFDIDAQFNNPVILLDDALQASGFRDVSGTGVIDISPTYGAKVFNYSGRVTYLGTQQITVPYGTFDTTRLRFNLDLETTIQGVQFILTYSAELWLAKGVGIVQRREYGETYLLNRITDTTTGSNKFLPVLDSLPASMDADGDGFYDAIDLFPNDKYNWTDLDGDGIGDNTDPDDDGDNVDDIVDAFPRDPSEWLDTDADGVGNNADADDDNDGLVDLIDPLPLDSMGPGVIYNPSPRVVLTTDNTVVLNGRNFSDNDEFYQDGILIPATVLSPNAVKLDLITPATPGISEIEIRYPGHFYISTSSIVLKAPIRYPYAEIPTTGRKADVIFNTETDTVYARNYTDSQIERYQFSSGTWSTASLPITDLRDMALSRDNSTLVAIAKFDAVEIHQPSFSVAATLPVAPPVGEWLSRIEFDYTNTAILISDRRSDPTTYDANPVSPTYGTVGSLSSFATINEIACATDGTRCLLGFTNGFSTPTRPYPLMWHEPITDQYTETSFTLDYYRNVTMNQDGTKILINTDVYDDNFSRWGTLSVGGGVISPNGDFVVGVRTIYGPRPHYEMYIYDISTPSSNGTYVPEYTADLEVEYLNLTGFGLSPDGLTLFITTEIKDLVVPLWQLKENWIGSPEICPSAGCGGIALAAGSPAPAQTDPLDPAFDNRISGLQHVSPPYAEQGSSIEVILTGRSFTNQSVVRFDNTVMPNVQFISDRELRVTLPGAFPTGQYTVTVDGHRTNAPSFKVINQVVINEQTWALGGGNSRWIELIYNPIANRLYGLTWDYDQFAYNLWSISPEDGSVDSWNSGFNFNTLDIAWCAEDDLIYMGELTDIHRFDPNDLSQPLDTIALPVGSGVANSLECIAEGAVVYTGHNNSHPYYVLDPDSGSVISSNDFVTYPRSSFYLPQLNGVSARGDQLIVGDYSNANQPQRIFYPLTLTQEDLPFSYNYTSGSWSFDGAMVVINRTEVYDDSFNHYGTLPTNIGAIIAPDGTSIYTLHRDYTISRIDLDYNNLQDLSVDATIPVPAAVGDIAPSTSNTVLMAVSLDGKTVFVAGPEGVAAISVK